MKTIKSRIALFVATLMFSVGLVASPAFALPGQLPSTVTGTVGDTFSHSLAPALCEGRQGPITYSMMDTLPTGLTLNATTGLISGTYEEEGTWQLSGYVYCQYTGSNGNPAQAGYPNSTTFTVSPPPAEFTPTPTLSVASIGGPDCTLEVTGEFPEVQDANSVKLIFESDNGILELTLANQAADTPFTFTYPINNYSPGTDPMVLAWDADGQIRCSTDVDVKLGYRYRTAPIEFAEVLATYATFDLPTRPHIAPAGAGDDLCGVYLSGRFPTSGDRGTKPMVTIESDTGEVAVIPAVDNQGVFYVWVPLDDLSEFEFYVGSLVLSGPTPRCGEMMFATASIWIEGQEQFASTMVSASRICEPGTFDTSDECAPAPAGSYVAGRGMSQLTPCPKGTFQNLTGATECQDAPVGTYSDRKGSIEPTVCPSGKVTLEPGASHVSECYSLKSQTFKILKTTSKLKFGASIVVPSVSDNQIPLSVQSIGNCTQSDTTMPVKIGKVTRVVPAVRITATSEAGQCSVRFNSEGDSYYRGFVKDMVIKVSRTGK
jgi:hypothetical protein